MIGPGKYDPHLSAALVAADAKQGVLLILDGNRGPGYSAHLTLEGMRSLAGALLEIAKQVNAEADRLSGTSGQG